MAASILKIFNYRHQHVVSENRLIHCVLQMFPFPHKSSFLGKKKEKKIVRCEIRFGGAWWRWHALLCQLLVQVEHVPVVRVHGHCAGNCFPLSTAYVNQL